MTASERRCETGPAEPVVNLSTALHRAGLATLTHTPSPMKFLNEILDRPMEEKPFLLLVVGYPSKGCEVPVIEKKPLEKRGILE